MCSRELPNLENYITGHYGAGAGGLRAGPGQIWAALENSSFPRR
jgi:hypothetical protein